MTDPGQKRPASTITVHDLIGIFAHAAAVLRWPAGSVQIATGTRHGAPGGKELR